MSLALLLMSGEQRDTRKGMFSRLSMHELLISI